MPSILYITPVDKLQEKISEQIKPVAGLVGVYVSLNKTQKSTEEMLTAAGIDTSRMFFIDCVTTEQLRDDVLHVKPEDLDTLSLAIASFIKDIPGEKFLAIDALSTLLI